MTELGFGDEEQLPNVLNPTANKTIKNWSEQKRTAGAYLSENRAFHDNASRGEYTTL